MPYKFLRSSPDKRKFTARSATLFSLLEGDLLDMSLRRQMSVKNYSTVLISIIVGAPGERESSSGWSGGQQR